MYARDYARLPIYHAMPCPYAVPIYICMLSNAHMPAYTDVRYVPSLINHIPAVSQSSIHPSINILSFLVISGILDVRIRRFALFSILF